ncbi:MAG: 50S ribosomal protein L5 [Chloroflexi bacterium]|nr:50S ribosomal protein L5 [Chloroflexota bacterium]
MSAQRRGKRGAGKAAPAAPAPGGVPAAPAAPQAPAGPPRLLVRYRKQIAPALQQEFGYGNPMQVPSLEKIVLNIGLGESLQNPKAMENAQRDLATISGQHPVVTKAKRSIAGFKIRRGMAIGVMVTLRGRRMWDFFDRLVNAALPRTRDFQGVSPDAMDERGNYSLGIKEQMLFPEIDYDSIDRARGLGVTIVTSARNKGEARRLLQMLGMPFTGGQDRG